MSGTRTDVAEVGLIIAVKRLSAAKTRLGPMFSDADRASLVLAMLADTITAAVAADGVDGITVVTPDDAIADMAGQLGARVLKDATSFEHPDPLNAAIIDAETAVRAWTPNVAVLHGDLPALRTGELTDALMMASAHGRSFVADRHGTGTSALFAFGVPLDPMFGRRSARRHALSGAVPLSGEWPGLRCDVDTPDDLAAARELGADRAGTSVGEPHGGFARFTGEVLADNECGMGQGATLAAGRRPIAQLS